MQKLKRFSPHATMFAAGILAAIALAPLHFWLLLIPAYTLLYTYLSKADSAKAAFRLSWCWGFGFFLAGLYWICISMTVDLPRFGWMIPFALLGLNGALAGFPAVAGWCLFHLRTRFCLRNDAAQWLLFALIFTASEWLRGHLFTGFPWNLTGYVWGASNHALQVASVFSIYPLTLLTLLMASAAALRHLRWRWPVMLSGFAFAVVLIYGEQRLQNAMPYEPKAAIRLVQGNIAQSLKWDPDFQREAFERHVMLSREFLHPPKYIIWSESALPFAIEDEYIPPQAFEWLEQGQILITGAVMRDAGRLSNSMVAIARGGKLLARYDKQHLVPFGEYVPLRGFLPIEKLTEGMGDFTSGTGARRLLDFLPLICYEVIFPSYASGEGEVILNLTNDDWFGISSGPFQHLMAARFRAVEQGKPVLRVANSGISAVIDAYGRVQRILPLQTEGVIDLR